MGSVGANKSGVSTPKPVVDEREVKRNAFIDQMQNGMSAILTFNDKSEQKLLADHLMSLDRPLKKNEFTTKSRWVGSRIQGGMDYGYTIIPPSGFPFAVVYRTASTKSSANALIKRFVDDYNEWYKRNK